MPDRRVLTRRDFVAGASVLVAGARTWAGTTAAGAAALTDLSAAEAVQRMRRGELSSEGYAEALLERCASAKALNAFITLEPDQVRRDARAADQLRARGAKLGPLHGLPIPVKDSVNTHDYPTSAGTAAAVAAHMAPLGIAADTEGSIRVPAAVCGLVGFRPTTGRYPSAGVAPITALFDQVGPISRSMRDIELFDSVVAGEHGPLAVPELGTVRLAVCRYFFDGLEPEVARVTDAALAKLKDAGVTLVETEIPELGDLVGKVTEQIQFHDTEPSLTRYLAEYKTGVTFQQLVAQASPDIRATFAQYVLAGGSDVVTDAVYRKAVDDYLPRLRRVLRETFARTRTAALVFPATMTTAPRIGDEVTLLLGGRKVSFDEAMSRNIAPGSTAGVPGLVLPAGLAANGMPVALEFDGPAGSDRALLGLGTAIERLLGTEPLPRI
jgi:indoleacetamide hydrolase